MTENALNQNMKRQFNRIKNRWPKDTKQGTKHANAQINVHHVIGFTWRFVDTFLLVCYRVPWQHTEK